MYSAKPSSDPNPELCGTLLRCGSCRPQLLRSSGETSLFSLERWFCYHESSIAIFHTSQSMCLFCCCDSLQVSWRDSPKWHPQTGTPRQIGLEIHLMKSDPQTLRPSGHLNTFFVSHNDDPQTPRTPQRFFVSHHIIMIPWSSFQRPDPNAVPVCRIPDLTSITVHRHALLCHSLRQPAYHQRPNTVPANDPSCRIQHTPSTRRSSQQSVGSEGLGMQLWPRRETSGL